MRHPDLLDRRRTCLLVVDVQEKLMPVIHDKDSIVENIRRLARGAQILGVPLLVSEQYPKGLGPTVEPVAKVLDPGAARCSKVAFSCIADQEFFREIEGMKRDTLLVCGAESHVCVLQTVLDALAAGFRVQVAADAVGSRDPGNKRIALERMARAGAVITGTESALFELLERAGTDEFKQVQALVK